MSAKTPAPQRAKKRTAKVAGFSDVEKEAMRERVREMKGEAGGKADGEAEVLAKIAAMKDPDRAMAKRLHALIKSIAPQLAARTWYGMPAYARDGKVLCFFQSGQRFKTRYATFGFSDAARLDDGQMWPTGFALKEMNAATEAMITDLIRKAIR